MSRIAGSYFCLPAMASRVMSTCRRAPLGDAALERGCARLRDVGVAVDAAPGAPVYGLAPGRSQEQVGLDGGKAQRKQ
jgi:hypothetical protein